MDKGIMSMNSNPKVSIILPVYNGEKYLHKSIESILKQSYANFELIIVNDFSNDSSLEIANSFAREDNRLIVISNDKNRGLPYSLNYGFSKASGELFTWTSDDNLFHRDAIYKMVSFLNSNPDCALVFADMNLIDENNEIIGQRISNNYNLFNKNCVGACFMYRSKCREFIGDYDISKSLVEDYDYWIRIASKYEINRIPEILYDYRYHNESLTVKKMRLVGERLTELRIEYLDRIAESVDEKNFKEILFEIIVSADERALRLIDKYITEDIDFILKRKKDIAGEDIWLFGAGAIGRSAIALLNGKNILGFIDNDSNKIGENISGKRILSINDFLKLYNGETVVISTELRYAYNIFKQLNSKGVDKVVLLYDLTL